MRAINNHFALALVILLLMAAPMSACAAGKLLPVPDGVPSPEDNPTTEEKAALGKMLFFDRRLSGDGTMSCANCHLPDMGFSDGLPISLNYPTTRNWRNSGTLINIAYATSLFHDGRAATLEEQALFPMMSAFEMNQNLDYLEEEIREVPQYVEAFRSIFKGEPTRQRIAMAIAAFERTLISRDSPLDRHLRGASDALSPAAARGLALFTGRAGCVRCHHGVNLSDGGFHNTGVPENERIKSDPRTLITVRFVAKVSGFQEYATLREDPGRYLVTRRQEDWKAFRTPSLRDVSQTGPYMHNGSLATLAAVVEFYDQGGGAGNTSGLKPLGLSAAERADIETFLQEALTGQEIEVKFPRIP